MNAGPGRPQIDNVALLTLLAALLLVVSLFLDWYELTDGSDSASLTGWSGLEVLDAILLMIAVAAAVAAVRPDLAPEWVTPLALGSIALILVAVALITKVPVTNFWSEASGADLDTNLKAGAFMALGGALLLLVAAAVERTTPAPPAPVAPQPGAQPPSSSVPPPPPGSRP